MSKRNIKDKIVKKLDIPGGVSARMEIHTLIVEGPRGEARRVIKKSSTVIRIEGKNIIVESERVTRRDKKIVGTLIAHINNMLNGVLNNHTYILKICSGHFPMNVAVSGNKFIVKNFLGEKVPRVLQLKESATIKVEGDLIYVSSADKELAGQVSADIEQLTRRPGYDSRIFQDGCYIVNKGGRELR